MPYRFYEDVAIADVAFEATGKTLEEMFVSAGLALTNTQVEDLKTVEAKAEKAVELEASDVENLLVNFLQELIFYKDAEQLLLNKFDIKIKKKKEKFKLSGKIYGEKLNPKKHELLVDVKAVAWHRFKVEKTKDGWSAFVILDV